MKKFFTDVYGKKEADVIFFGVDYTKDSKKALNQLREASWFVEPFDPDKKKNLLENIKLFDIGNKKIRKMSDISKLFSAIRKSGKIPFMLSRGHLASYYTTKTLPENTKIVIFDAHCDLQDEYIDELISWDVPVEKANKKRFNGSTWLRRLTEIRNPKNIMLIGIRSFDEDELNYMREKGILFYTSKEVKEKTEEVKLILRQFTNLSNVYVSLDADVFDPSIAPAVDYPEPDGIYFNHFRELAGSIVGRIVGFDTTCFKPIDDNLVTEFLLVKSILVLLSRI